MEKRDREEADIISREATEDQGKEKGGDEPRNKDGSNQEERR
jgi:hypothetical protein